MSYRFDKDPDGVVDFAIDWSTWLDGDTISTSTFTVPTGITKNSESNTTTTATVWLSGGTARTTYTLTNRITTAGGRTNDAEIRVVVGGYSTLAQAQDASQRSSDYLDIAADLVATWTTPPDPVTDDYIGKAARAERLVFNYLLNTSGNSLIGASLSGTGSLSFAQMSAVKGILRDTMGDYYTAGSAYTLTVDSSFPVAEEGA